MKFFFLVLFLFSAQLIASDCVGLKEGEVIRLDKSGKSLANFQTQDQDGLNTCASNATSLIMHSILDENPTLSYIQFASIYKNSAVQKNRDNLLKNKSQVFKAYARENNNIIEADSKTKSEDRWDLGLDYGDICEIIQSAKNYQKEFDNKGICKSESVNIEKLAGSRDEDYLQKKSILAVSKYMNEFQKNFGEQSGPEAAASNQLVRKKYQNFKIAFEAQLKKKENLHNKECNKINKDVFEPLFNSMSGYFLTFEQCFNKNKMSKQAVCSLLNNILTVKTLPNGALKTTYSEKFTSSLMSSFGPKNKVLNSSDVKIKLYSSLREMNGANFDEETEQFVQWMMDDVKHKDEDRIVDEVNEVNKTGSSKVCLERKFMNYLTSDDFKKDANLDPVLCNSSKLIGNVKDVIATTVNQGLIDSARVRDFLLKNANLNLEPAMMSLYAFDCSEKDKVKIPESVKCVDYPVNIVAKAELNAKIIYKLKNNQALGLTICGAIIKKPKSQFADKECNLHSVGLIGVQCKNGKMKYLIQNSWGKSNFANNSAIETDASENGSYWFDEKSFFDGASKLNSVSK